MCRYKWGLKFLILGKYSFLIMIILISDVVLFLEIWCVYFFDKNFKLRVSFYSEVLEYNIFFYGEKILNFFKYIFK